MATTEVTRLAPATARDGVDTRTKDLTTRSGGGDREQGDSNAVSEFDEWLCWPNVNLNLVAPAGVEVEGAPIWGAWGRYETVAKRHMEDSDESFRWVSYQTQVERAEEDLLGCVPEKDQMTMVYLNEINRAITSVGYAITRARRELTVSPFMLDFHKTVVLSRMADVDTAVDAAEDAAEDDGWRGDCGPCACGEKQYIDGLCADCFWEQDAQFKQKARALRPPPRISIPNIVLSEPEVRGPRVE